MRTMHSLALFLTFPAGKAFAPVHRKPMAGRSVALRYANDHNDRLPAVLRPFDLNGDGKLDEMDIKILQLNALQAFDLNGDGQVNEHDLFRGIQLVTLAWVLMASPAGAKGGGHGGGHSGGHSSTHHHSGGSSSYASSRSYYEAPYRRDWIRRNRQYDKPWNPAACYDLPGEGEHVEVLTPTYNPFAARKYTSGLVIEVRESSCVFTVREEQLSNEANAEKDPLVRSVRTIRNWEDEDLLSFYCIAIFGGFAAGLSLITEALNFYKDNRFDEEFLKAEPGFDAFPADGQYYGSTEESDGANQEVKVRLRFNPETREITGSGYDSEDGRYTLEGELAGNKLKWKERYLDGGEAFTVDVRGELNEDCTRLDCWFTSSRGVRGNFVLRKVPDWIPFFSS